MTYRSDREVERFVGVDSVLSHLVFKFVVACLGACDSLGYFVILYCLVSWTTELIGAAGGRMFTSQLTPLRQFCSPS
jgi:hypothetical protein